MTLNPLTWPVLLRYGVLGIPLAFAGLPVYVHVPKFYADVLHMDLSALGQLLLILRLFDAVTDPLIGILSDRLSAHRRFIMSACVPVLLVGYVALFNPSPWAFAHPAIWLTGSLLLVYMSFSALMINYYAVGVDMASSFDDNTRIAAFREGSMLVGVLLASVMPTVLMQHFDVQRSYSLFSLALAPLLIVCAVVCLSALPRSGAQGNSNGFGILLSVLAISRVRWILAIGFSNALPTAITSTLFLFFTHDILHADSYSGPLLALYFLSAACGMPLWTKVSYSLGKKHCLLIAMTTAIVCFVWAWRLGAGDVLPFAVICVLSGMTLGADSVLLPSMLSDALMDRREAAATGFGLWNLTSKLTMACAAGLALPLLAWGGYHSAAHNTLQGLHTLSFCYGLLPCLFKAIAIVLLYASPTEPHATQRNVYAGYAR
jgi:Na+/melibiose symporter-like transporter